MTYNGHGYTPKPFMVPLPEWNPESLPGYAEAKAKAERGEPLFDKPPARVKGPARLRRSLESLVAERDRLMTRRDGLGGAELPDDPGALSGIRRKASGVDRRRSAKTDRELGLYVSLSQRIAYLNGRIARHE